MTRLITWTGAAIVALGTLTLADTPKANAGGFSLSIGNFGYGVPYYNNRSRYGAYRYGHSSHRHRSYRVPRYYAHPRTPHYDYHPPQLVPHRGHLDYVPGHFDFHHRGHYHH